MNFPIIPTHYISRDANYYAGFPYIRYYFPGDLNNKQSNSLPSHADLNQGIFTYYDFCASLCGLLNDDDADNHWVVAYDAMISQGERLPEDSYTKGFIVEITTGMVLSPYIDFYRKKLKFSLRYFVNGSKTTAPLDPSNEIKYSAFPSPSSLVKRINKELLNSVNFSTLAMIQSRELNRSNLENERKNILNNLSLDFGFQRPSEREIKNNKLIGYMGITRVEIAASVNNERSRVDLELWDISPNQAEKIADILKGDM